jgi:hypothetical protein
MIWVRALSNASASAGPEEVRDDLLLVHARCALNISEYLSVQLRDLDESTDVGTIDEPSQEEAQLFEVFHRIEVDSVESLLPVEAARIIQQLHLRRDILEYALDDRYSRKLLEQIPSIVKRALKLHPVFVPGMLTGPTEIYLREATRSYLFGLFQSSAALSRCAFGHCLRESLHASPLVNADELSSLIRAAERIKQRVLVGDALQLAHEVRKIANEVLHGKPCTEQESFGLLTRTRTVLDSVYRRRA